MSAPRTRPDNTDSADASGEDDMGGQKQWDVFISYATEDKEAVAAPLANELKSRGLRVWYDDFELRVGDSLSRSIDNGISRSRFGLVILSKSFFDKSWTQHELGGLVARTNNEEHRLLPIWHEISKDEVITHSAPLADKVALLTSDLGIDEIADKITSEVTGSPVLPARSDTTPPQPRPARTRPTGTNSLTITSGPHRRFFSGVNVSLNSDLQGRYFLDIRKNDISSDEYAGLCSDLASTQGAAGGWRAHLDIDGQTFDFENCEVTPNDTSRNLYYIDVRTHTDASNYKQVANALAAAAQRRT